MRLGILTVLASILAACGTPAEFSGGTAVTPAHLDAAPATESPTRAKAEKKNASESSDSPSDRLGERQNEVTSQSQSSRPRLVYGLNVFYSPNAAVRAWSPYLASADGSMRVEFDRSAPQ